MSEPETDADTDVPKVETPLHSDDSDNPLNLSVRDYWTEYERFKAEHPDATPPIPEDQLSMYTDDDTDGVSP